MCAKSVRGLVEDFILWNKKKIEMRCILMGFKSIVRSIWLLRPIRSPLLSIRQLQLAAVNG